MIKYTVYTFFKHTFQINISIFKKEQEEVQKLFW